jgi:thiamine-phosphate pyrophosphorylase
MKDLDLGICVLTANVSALHRTHEQVAAAAIQGGASMIQFRDKTMADEAFAETALRILRMSRSAGVPLIVNDRVSIAIAIGADGVHIGSMDGDAEEIRRTLPQEMILGVSARNYAEAMRMDDLGANYLGVGPVFPTNSKEDVTPPIGVVELELICRNVRTPVVAIGGVNAKTLHSVICAGVAGVAVISAVSHAPDMAISVRELSALRQKAGLSRGGELPGACPGVFQ